MSSIFNNYLDGISNFTKTDWKDLCWKPFS